MKNNQVDTPPGSVNGDDIDEGFINLDEMEEYDFDDEEIMEVVDSDDEVERPPPVDESVLKFEKHDGSVFCCDLHPNGQWAVTGGEDDKAYVWSVETGQLIMTCNGHKDSVTFVGFSFDGSYLCTTDMSGVIKVWKWELESDVWPVVFQYEANDLTWGLWHFGVNVFICGSVTGDIYVFKIPSGDIKILQGHNIKVECGKLFKDGTRLAAGYGDGAVKVWDIKTCSVLQQLPSGTHQIAVTGIDTHPENNLMASISSEGKLVIATSTNGKIVAQLLVGNDLETVAFAPSPLTDYLAIGTLDGIINIWDTTRQILRHRCAKSTDESPGGATKMFWVKDQLVIGCTDGTIRVYDSRTGAQRATMKGHYSEILDLCYDEKTNVILTASDDGTARIFKCEILKEIDK